jgi:hypothetical protein
MLGEKQNPVVKKGGYYRNVTVEGTKELKGRGWYYDYAIISPNGNIEFGSEDGNYAGGIFIWMGMDNYESRVERQLKWIQEHDKQFYDLVQQEVTIIKEEFNNYLEELRCQQQI